MGGTPMRLRHHRYPRKAHPHRCAARVTCEECRATVARALTFKYRTPGYPAFFRCHACAEDVARMVERLLRSPLADEPDA